MPSHVAGGGDRKPTFGSKVTVSLKRGDMNVSSLEKKKGGGREIYAKNVSSVFKIWGLSIISMTGEKLKD